MGCAGIQLGLRESFHERAAFEGGPVAAGQEPPGIDRCYIARCSWSLRVPRVN